MKKLTCLQKLFEKNAADFQIVWHKSTSISQIVSNRQGAKYLSAELFSRWGVRAEAVEDTADGTEYEIQIGTVDIDRAGFLEIFEKLEGESDYIVAVKEKRITVAATDRKSLAHAIEYLIQMVLSPAAENSDDAPAISFYQHSKSETPYEISVERLREIYPKSICCYPVSYGWGWDNEVDPKARADQKMVDAIRAAMGETAVFCDGKTVALYDGYVRKLDVTDYTASAQMCGEELLVPAYFLNFYFETDAYEGLVPLSRAAAERGCGLSRYGDMTLLSQSADRSFRVEDGGIDGYSNQAVLERLRLFFDNPEMPEPLRDTEQTRVVVEDAVDYYPEDSMDASEPTYTSYYSPGILVAKDREGNRVIYASNEHCRVKSGAEPASATVIHKSLDGGLTWKTVNYMDRLKWATIFLVKDQMYIIGFLKDSDVWRGDTVIGRVNEGEDVELHVLRPNAEISCMSPLITDEMIYLPTDFGMASASVNSNLLDAESWTVTQSWDQLVSREWFTEITGKSLVRSGTVQCMEASAVMGRDGAVYGLYRTECQPNGNYAILFRLSEDRTRLELLQADQSLIRLPTTVSRFIVRYDAISDRYICVSNWWLTKNFCRARNALGISMSEDLIHWEMLEVLLRDREMMNAECACWKNAFQYQDIDFDGDDIVMTVREATGFTNTFHDGKYLTFYRVKNFRSLLSPKESKHDLYWMD